MSPDRARVLVLIAAVTPACFAPERLGAAGSNGETSTGGAPGSESSTLDSASSATETSADSTSSSGSTSTSTSGDADTSGESSSTSDDESGSTTGGPATCNGSASDFGPPVEVTALNTADSENSVWFSPDELTVYIGSNRPGGAGGHDIFTATRDSVDAEFGEVTALEGVNTAYTETRPTLTSDALTLFCASNIPGVLGSTDIVVSTRPNTLTVFGSLSVVASINTAAEESDPWISPDGESLYFWSSIDGTPDLLHTQRRQDGSFGPPIPLGLDTPEYGESDPALTGDELTIAFASNRPDSIGAADLWLSSRASTDEEFDEPERIVEASSVYNEFPAWLSADGCRLYFVRNAGGDDIWVTERYPADGG